MPHVAGKCPVCEERKYLMPKVGMCRQCYGKLYYQKNKERLKEYYRQYNQAPPPLEDENAA